MAAAPEDAATPVGGDDGEYSYEEDNCVECGEPIDGPCVNALDKSWHPPCFVCTECKQPFPNGQFFPKEGLPYCETDFHTLFGVTCFGCNELITARCLTAMDAKWHPDCFICFECGESLAGGSFVKYEEKAHCKPCAKEKKKKKHERPGITCARCKETIEGEFIVLQGQRMHPYHFSCHKCKKPFQGSNCHEYEGRLYCDPHYRELLNAMCAQCRKPITGRAVTALGKQWHPEHFVCTYCEQPFAGQDFMVQDGRPYCEPHWVQEFGKVCHWCKKPISGTSLSAMDRQYHPEHFVCATCDVPLTKGRFAVWERKPQCSNCHTSLPKAIRDRQKNVDKAERRRAAAEATSTS